MRKSQRKEDDSVAQFPVCKQRLLAEDHTQHPCGTAERLTLRYWFSVNSVSTMRRKAREQKGEKVGENCTVEQCLHSDSQCGCKSAASLRWEKV